MQYARKLRKGDKVAIVSLSSGMLGEEFCSHNIEIGVKRLKEYGLEPVFMPNALKGIEYLQTHLQARAKDLKDAFLDNSIAGIICAIGGDDTYRLLPYLMEDEEFIKAVEEHPKLFTGFSDTTINHLMFYKLGLSTYYGPNFIWIWEKLQMRCYHIPKGHLRVIWKVMNLMKLYPVIFGMKKEKIFQEPQ